jgi:hypothetical protein
VMYDTGRFGKARMDEFLRGASSRRPADEGWVTPPRPVALRDRVGFGLITLGLHLLGPHAFAEGTPPANRPAA